MEVINTRFISGITTYWENSLTHSYFFHNAEESGTLKNTVSNETLPVLYQLLDGVGRTLYDFSSCDPVDDCFVKPSNDTSHDHSPAE